MTSIFMLMIKTRFLLLGLLFMNQISFSQTGIFHWADEDEEMIHNRIIDIKQLSDQSLVVLSKLEDENYENMFPAITKMRTNGDMILSKFIERYHLYELNGALIQPDQNIRIFGTEMSTTNGLTPYYDWISQLGLVIPTKSTMSAQPTFIGDLQMIGDAAVILKSVINKSKKYNLIVNKIIPSLTDSVLWTCKIESAHHEEGNKIVFLDDGAILILARSYTDETMDHFTAVIYKISKAGKLLWSKELSDVKDYFSHSLLTDHSGNLIYSFSFSDDENGECHTMMRKLDADAKMISEKRIDGIRSNSMIQLTNGNVLIAGCGFVDYPEYFLTKAKNLVLSNSDFSVVNEFGLSSQTQPETDFPVQEIAYMPASSEYFCATLLTDGTVSLGGRALLPIKSDPLKLLKSPRRNENLLVILNDKGEL